MKILFVASEGLPFIKTGGLADVIGTLPKELKKQGLDVRVFLPNYKQISNYFKGKMILKEKITITLGWRQLYCGIFELVHGDITYYFVDNQYYFYRDEIYGYNNSFDEAERFTFFSQAVLEALPYLDFQPDAIHLHDWQTALISVFLKAKYQLMEFYHSIRTIFTIHNLKYQGIFPKDIIGDLFQLDSTFLSTEGLEFYGQINFLKGGIVYSDIITTVSPTYAREIQTPYYGEALDGLLRKRNDQLYGIINGIDTDDYNPATDSQIFYNYKQSIVKKKRNKVKLQETLLLPINEKIPMIAMVSRLVTQKGFDLVIPVLDEILSENVQLVILGSGEKHYENMLINAMIRFPEKISVHTIFDDDFARKIYAASDLFLMPSLFEPCGLSQLIALRYKSVPIVRETGGLKDTVQSYNEWTGEGNGFSFSNYNAHDMLYTLRRAINLYHCEEHWNQIQQNIKVLDYSWQFSSKRYIELYQLMLSA